MNRLLSPPDLVLYNGNLLDPSAPDRTATALAIKGGRIVHVGDDPSVRDLAGISTIGIDVGERRIIPGLIDSHAHLDREGLRRRYPSLSECRTIADIQKVIAQAAADLADDEWVVTSPLGEPPFHLHQAERLEEGRFPTRRELDVVEPNRPVWIRPIWGHWSNRPPMVHVLNSSALRECGITEETESPISSIEIERDQAGDLTGRILEYDLWPAAEFTLLRAAPRIDAEARREALRVSMRLASEVGITGVFEGHGLAPEVVRSYQRLGEDGEQTIRAVYPVTLPPYESVTEGIEMLRDWGHLAGGLGGGDRWIKPSGVFVEFGGYGDVARAAQSAWPYTGWAGFGAQINEPTAYQEICLAAARLGVRVVSIIKLTLPGVLDAWETVDEEIPIGGRRWVLAHGHLTTPAMVRRIATLGAAVTTQPPSYLYRSGADTVGEGADPETLLAHRDFLDAGVPWALSTDNKPYNPWFAIWVSVARTEMHSGATIGENQRVTVREALRAFTEGGAYLSGDERVRGRLAAGCLADLAVLDDDPEQVDGDALREIGSSLTMVDGNVVHNDGALDAPASPFIARDNSQST